MKPEKSEEVWLPWGLPIRIYTGEAIGSCIWRTGVHDLLVTECLWRLLDPGETSVDVGANIGYMTGLMARRIGMQGRVIALEPHPEVFAFLRGNVDQWRTMTEIARIDLLEKAASEASGKAALHMCSLFLSNWGVASLESSSGEMGESQNVEVTTLDDLFEPGVRVDVVKLDVEGHELATLKGASRLLEERAIRDIVFEDHGIPPTLVMEWLAGFGYEIFFLDLVLWGPRIAPVNSAYRCARMHERNFLATLDAKRALERLAPRGWRVLKTRNKQVAG